MVLKQHGNDLIAKETTPSTIQVPSKEKTLYERIGGEAQASLLAANFLDEILENRKLAPFFKHVPVTTLRRHHVKLFRVIFGPEEERPSPDDFQDYILATHSRLFREMKLDEKHFDKIIDCFKSGFETLQVKQSLIKECVEVLSSLRPIFEYGAKVAADERNVPKEKLPRLPIASTRNRGRFEQVALPDPQSIACDIPDWLPEALGKHSKEPDLRVWTCDLTEQFGPEGDDLIADTFMDMPYISQHVYLVSFLQLAFLPEGDDSSQLLQIVRLPRGPMNSALCLVLWKRMISQFFRTARNMFMETFALKRALERLNSYNEEFPDTAPIRVNGMMSMHALRQAKIVESVDEKRANMSRRGSLRTLFRDTSLNSFGDASSVSSFGRHSRHSNDGKRVWRGLFGWMKARPREPSTINIQRIPKSESSTFQT